MTEFTTWRSLVDGAEISAIPDSVVFLPEEDDLDNFGGATSDYVIDSSQPKFNTEFTDLSLKVDAVRPDYIGSLSGLNRYPKVGETHRVAIFLEDTDSWPRVHFGCDSVSGVSNSYSVNLRRPNDEDRLEIDRYDDGDRNSGIADINNVGLNVGEWHEVEILHEANGDMTVTLFDNNGSEIDSLNHNDDTHITDGEYDGNGIGIVADFDDSIGVAWDYWRIIE